MMLNSFKYPGISNPLDGSKDDKFRGYKDIENEMRVFKLRMMMSYI